MRAKEILRELREIMDRTKYGAWVDAKNMKVYPVDKYGHIDFIKKIAMQKHGLTFSDLDGLKDEDFYKLGFGDHLVRVNFPERSRIGIEGTSADIQKVANILLATCVQPDVDVVYVDKHDTATADSSGNKVFFMPERRRDLMMYLKNEVE